MHLRQIAPTMSYLRRRRQRSGQFDNGYPGFSCLHIWRVGAGSIPVRTPTSSTDPPETSSTRHPASRQSVFATTRWSVVLAAGHSGTTDARAALGKLCQTYWYPLYAYVRRRGHSPEDAQDLTQEFFAQLLKRQSLARADPNLGRFRSFLLGTMNHFLANEWQKAQAKKRGHGRELLSLDWAAAEDRFDLEPADNAAPDRIFEKQWALTLLGEVLNRLEQEYQSAGKSDWFLALKQALMGARESQPYAELAAQLGSSESAVKVAVHRLRKRYRELVREEIAGTLDGTQEVDSEMRHLFSVLATR